MTDKPTQPTPPTPAVVPLDHTSVGWLLAVALLTTAPHAEYLPWWLSSIGALLLLWRALLWQRQGPLPRHWLLLLVVLACIGAIFLQYRTLFGRDAGVALLFLFMALKSLETTQRRDAVVLVMLGYFLLLTHYFYSQSIAVGAWLLLAATVLTATLLRLHGHPGPVLQTLRQAALMLAQALPLMLLLFLLFPRINGPLWGLPQDAHSGRTGLSDEMTPGSISNLIQSGRIAFRARFDGPPPAPAERYWRGPVLESYDGRTWRPGPLRPPTIQHFVASIAASTRYEMTIEPHNQRWLLALEWPVAFPAEATLDANLSLVFRDPLHQRTRIHLASATGSRAQLSEPPEKLEALRRLPADYNPATRALAAQWRQQQGDAAAIISSALQYFRTQDFVYTLQPPLLGRHGIDEFLFQTRRGFCEHFASAFVVLMRAAGLPARVVTGYQGGEPNPVDAYLTIRQSDAHAWAEVWIDGQGWLRVDPTAAVAPSRIEDGLSAALPADEPLPALMQLDSDWIRGLRYRWEAANNAWNQWVLGYNPVKQRELLSQLGFTDPDWRRLAGLLFALCGLVLLAMTALLLRRQRSKDPALRQWQLFCARLGKLGYPRADWEGPADYAHRLAAALPAQAALIKQAAECYAELRYGARTEHDPGYQRRLRALRQLTARLPRRLQR